MRRVVLLGFNLGRREFACNFAPRNVEVRFGEIAALVEVTHVGFGFTHTRRAVYERIQEACELPVCNDRWGGHVIPFFLPIVVHEEPFHHYMAEDYAFCERARSAGFKILADTRIRLWHVGNFQYSWEDARRDVERYGRHTYHINDAGASDKE